MHFKGKSPAGELGDSLVEHDHNVGRLLDAATDPAAERAALAARQPMGRLVTADEVANAIVYLASPLSASTTGTALAVDGGMYGLRPRGPVQQ